MTLEDFFTLTEMKDGLTSPSRVQELVSVMQKEKDCVVKNAGDTTRQWAAVASTIAATENKDCLDLFIQLDGLWFINRWLTDAQNFVDTKDGFIEESITALLRAVEKLHLDGERSISSGIWVTVRNLLSHQNSRVQDRARVLFDSWRVGGNVDVDPPDKDLVRDNDRSEKVVREEGGSSALNESSSDTGHASGLVGGEKTTSMDSPLPERVVSVQVQNSNNQLLPPVNSDCRDVKERSPDDLSNVSTSVQEVASTKEVLCVVGGTSSTRTCSFPFPKQGNVEGRPDVLNLNDLSKKEKQEQNINGPSEKQGVLEISSMSTMPEPEPGPAPMGASEEKAFESVKEPVSPHKVENDEDMTGVDDIRDVNPSSAQLLKTAGKDENCHSDALQDLSVSGNDLGKPEVLESSFSRTEYVRAVKEVKGHVSNEGKDISNGSDSFKPGKVRRNPNMIDKKSSDIELEYGIVDALEVARKVAQEVEREVGDYRETFCSSSSEKISEGGIRQPGSPDSIDKEDAVTSVPPMEVPSRQSNSADTYPEEEGHASISDNTEDEPDCIPEVESSQVTEAAQEPGGNSEKSLCIFDLNEEVGSDDLDVSVNPLSMPIPIVSASKPVATSGLPVAPLHFEGTLGWKGSAATSAFRPASPRKNSDSEKNLSVSGNSDISKQRKDCLDFDLNVIEGEDGSGKQIAELSGLPSGQSSVELSPKRSSRIELDLNSIGDDGDTQPSDQRMEGHLFYSRNGHWSPSPASSSSSMQPSIRNIDLNDRPHLQTDFADQGPSKSSQIIHAYGASKTDAPVISLLGTKVEVSGREFVPQTLSLPNGNSVEPAVDLTMSRGGGILGMGGVSYNQSSVLGYNGLTQMPTLSLPSAMYGSGGTVPYMVDSRGTPVVPQIAGSSSTVLSSYSQPPFIMSMTNAQLSLNGMGPSRPNFDLYSGFMIDAGNRDALTARQIFFPGQSRALEEEHVRTIPQPSSSGVGGKRKEPDGGWETYPFNYKHPQPPWK
ncbi:hypothetical protein L6164_015252 [Bauhinia variegata]|uniref:Uncharacterized protein n=1 Tax=Bauhinia variegata TaxID=167791 RepID=A0ACB9NLZ0_BAUVA|nr:hypothetical protein L6164_015252 [Bauhinia variegata]